MKGCNKPFEEAIIGGNYPEDYLICGFTKVCGDTQYCSECAVKTGSEGKHGN